MKKWMSYLTGTRLAGILVIIWLGLAAYLMTFATLKKATFYLAIFTGVLTLAIWIYAFVEARQKRRQNKRWKRIVLAVLLAIPLILVNVVNAAVSVFPVVVNQFLYNTKTDSARVEKAETSSKEMVEQLADEGIVLLKNDHQTLPLTQSKKINIFGQSSVQPVYGGSGSGAGDTTNNVTLEQGLEQAGFEVNAELVDFYNSQKKEIAKQNNFELVGADYRLSEPEISSDLMQNAAAYSDTALIYLARRGGEGGDLPISMADYTGEADKHYLELSSQEEAMLKTVLAADFKRVIVVINSSNAMELGFLEDQGVDAAVTIGGPGATGFNSLGKILNGDVNPSGRLVDTYAYDVTSSPAYYNSGDFKTEEGIAYVNYQEGIYVGYRYYETRFVDNATGKVDETAYDKTVQYPFGYGLSYTTFNQEITGMEEVDGQIQVKVKVTNTGDVAGKDVAQVYYTAPYTVGGIEKSHVVLAGFDKTETLEPGASEELTISFSREDLASYDYQTEKAYVLDAGKYEIKLMNNAHDVLDEKDYTVAQKEVLNQRSSDKAEVTNAFDEAIGTFTYVTRSNWEASLPTERPTSVSYSQDVVDDFNSREVVGLDDEVTDITYANNGLSLKDLVGLDYDDPKWEKLLEQLSVEEMGYLIGNSLYSTQAIPSVGKPETRDTDGPAGLNNILRGVAGTQYASSVVIASTWNQSLVEKAGEVFAEELAANGYSGVYAPAVNIHRTPFSGRNFEYYSEDPTISGDIASAFVKGANKKGVYTYVKHFALNDQETNRTAAVATWSNEQAIREIYLKAFEIPVKEGGTTAIMSSYNSIGTTWAGAHKGLLTTVLRDEWGFKGMVVTDMNIVDYMDADQAVMAGGDLMLAPFGKVPTKLATTPAGRQAMRTASHRILYTVANSNAFAVQAGLPLWILIVAVVEALLFALIFLGYKRLFLGR